MTRAADPGPERRHHERSSTSDIRGRPSLAEGVFATVMFYIVVVFVLGLLSGLLLAVVLPNAPPEDQASAFVLLELGSLAIAVVLGLRFAGLSGWRAVLILAAGGMVGWFSLDYLVLLIGDALMFAMLGGAIVALIALRRRR